MTARNRAVFYLHFSLSFLFSLLLTFCFAQQDLPGIVTAKGSATPVPGVLVYIPELQKGAFTDNDGTFKMVVPSAGIITIQLSSVGYKTFIKTINLSDSVYRLPGYRMPVSMEPSATELEEVVVTANNVKLPDNIPYPVSTVSKEELNETGGLTLMSRLARQPGVDYISLGNNIGKPVIRGSSFNRVMVYAMGTKIENQPWDDRHDLGISEAAVDKVEIISGPSALMYGPDAMGGALIFVDEKPAPAGKSSGDVTMGFNINNLGSYADAGFKKTSDNGLFYILRANAHGNASYRQGDFALVDKNNPGGDFAANSKAVDMSGKAAVGISKSWGVSKLTYNYYHQLTGVIEAEPDSVKATESSSEQRTYDVEAPYQDVTSNILSNENTFLTGRSKLNINIAYQNNNRKEFEPLPGKQQKDAIGLNLNVLTYDVKWSSDAEKKFGYTLGTQSVLQKNENFGEEVLVPDATVNDYAGYALVRYDVPAVNILGGIRYDVRDIKADSAINRPAFSTHYSPLSGSLGAAFHPLEDITLKLNTAAGFSAPNYAELGTYGRHEGTYRFEIGNPNLNMEQNLESDIGFIYKTGFVSFNASVYYNAIRNYIYISPSGDTIGNLPVYRFVQNNAVIRGGTVGLDIHPKEWKWFDLKRSWSFTRGTVSSSSSNDNLPLIPSNKIISELRLTTEKKIGSLIEPYILFVMSNYLKQKRVAEYELPTNGYSLFDVRTGAEFRMGKQEASFAFFVTNILNKAYYSHLSLMKNIGVYEMGRNIGMQLAMKI